MDFSSFLLIFTILLISGIIAYLGDILGRRIGKRRLSVWKLRPRYTAILMSIVTGILIAAVTLTLLSLASEDVRTALFGMAELRERLEELNLEVIERNMELATARRELENYQQRIGELEQRERDLQVSSASLEEQVGLLSAEVGELRSQRNELREEIQLFQAELTRLRSAIMAIRQGEILFRDDEEILRAIAPAVMDEGEAEEYLVSLIRRADELAVLAGAGKDVDTQRSIFVLEDNYTQTLERLTDASNEHVIRLVASINVLKGEPVISRFLIDENRRIFADGEVVMERLLRLEEGTTNVELQLGELLQDLNTLGVRRGILPQQGRVGIISATNLSETTRTLESLSGEVTIQAVATGDVYTAGPLRVRLHISD